MTTDNTTTPPAPREYCVYATQTVCLHVEAKSAEAAYRRAKRKPHDFEPCGPDLTFDRAVRDVKADEYVHVGSGPTRCASCDSDIVPTINGSNFGEGECGPCEYRRYHSQPGLAKACEGATGLIVRDKNDNESIDLDLYERAERACRSALRKAHG